MHKTASIVFLLLTLLISLLLSGMTEAKVKTASPPMQIANVTPLAEGFHEKDRKDDVEPKEKAAASQPVITSEKNVRVQKTSASFQPWDELSTQPPQYTKAYDNAQNSTMGDNKFQHVLTSF